MKIAFGLVGFALLISSVVMLVLLRSGGALKPAGVIKPSELGSDPTLVGRYVATRLYPEIHAAPTVIWYLEDQQGLLAQIPWQTFAHLQGPTKPTIQQRPMTGECPGSCWYLQPLAEPLPSDLEQKVRSGQAVEIFVRTFDRAEPVPEHCEQQKILDGDCLRAVSVREVRRKLKTPAPYFFMQRYLDAQFYLFLERPLAKNGASG